MQSNDSGILFGNFTPERQDASSLHMPAAPFANTFAKTLHKPRYATGLGEGVEGGEASIHMAQSELASFIPEASAHSDPSDTKLHGNSHCSATPLMSVRERFLRAVATGVQIDKTPHRDSLVSDSFSAPSSTASPLSHVSISSERCLPVCSHSPALTTCTFAALYGYTVYRRNHLNLLVYEYKIVWWSSSAFTPE